MLPQEYAAKKVLPPLRAAVARLLLDRGVSQHRVARLLGVTQPMVHRYASFDLDSHISALETLGIPESLARSIVEIAAAEVERRGVEALAILLNWATLYTRYCRDPPVECRKVLCTGPGVYELILDALISTPGFERLVPEVGSNLAYAPSHARDPGDVLALDGRIIVAGGRPVAAGKPRLGGSRHTAAAAVAYKEVVGGEAWAVALRGEDWVLEKLRSLGVPVVTLGEPAPSGRAVAVVEPGGPGREQVVYLVAGDPATLYDLVSLLASDSSR